MDLKKQMAEIWRGNKQPSQMGRFLGFELVEYGDGSAFFTMVITENHYNFMNTVLAGALVAMAEATIGVAFASVLNDGEAFTISQIQSYHLRAVRTGRIDAHARVIERGRSLGIVECELINEAGLLITKVSATCFVLSDKVLYESGPAPSSNDNNH